MVKLQNTLIAFLLTLNLLPLSSDASELPKVESVNVKNNIYFIRSNTNYGNPTSVVSIDNNSTFLADANFGAVTQELLEEIKKLGGGNIKYVTTTHHHGDHTEGLENLPSDAVVITPTKQRERLRTGNIVKGQRPINKESLPTMTFTDEVVIHQDEEEIIIFTPPNTKAHTDGDAFVYFKNANIIYLGDHFFYKRFPIVDLNNGGSIDGMLDNLQYVLDKFEDDLIIIPGHGTFPPAPLKTFNKSDLSEYLSTLRKSIAHVHTQIKAGKSIAEIQENGLPAEFDPYLAKPRFVSAERWIKYVIENDAMYHEPAQKH